LIREVGELDAAIAPTDLQAHTLVELPPSIAQLVPPLPHQEQPPPKKLLPVSRAIQLLRRVLHNVGRTKEGVAREEARRGQRGSERNAEGCDIFQNDWGGTTSIMAWPKRRFTIPYPIHRDVMMASRAPTRAISENG
jgi:hypothetical protein